MNALEIDGDDGRHAASPLGMSEEPIPGKLYKRTSLQKLRPWDHPELAKASRTDVKRVNKDSVGGPAATSLVLLFFSVLVTALVVGVARQR